MALSSGQTAVPFVNDKEQGRLEKLKDSLEKGSIKFKMDDMTLVRFLRARNLDIHKTESMIKATLAWREQWEGEYLAWDPTEELITGFDLYRCGSDHDGRPVYYAPLGNWTSARDLYVQGKNEDCLRYAAKSMDMVYTELLNTKHQNFVCIVDIAGATYRDALHEVQNFKGIQDLIWLFKEYEANYPETLYKAFVINSPSVFYWGFNIVKPLMSQNTLDKIKIYPASDPSWYSSLLEVVPESSIPKSLGGTGPMNRFY